MSRDWLKKLPTRPLWLDSQMNLPIVPTRQQEKSNWAESIKSSSLLFDLEIPPTKAEESQSDESSEQCEGKPIEKNQRQNLDFFDGGIFEL